MGHQTAAGATLSMSSAAPASYDAAGFEALSDTVIGEITNIGEFGKEFAAVTHQPLASRGTKKGKGSFNNGTLNPTLALDNSDAGQTAMKAALASDDPVYFILTLQGGEKFYFEGLVMSFKPSVGGVDDVVTATSNIEITDKEILEA